MIPQLAWTDDFYQSIQRATGGQVKQIEVLDHVDPLKKLVVFTLHEPISCTDYNLFTSIFYAFAKANNCYVESFRTTSGRQYTASILIKTRLGPVSRKNPLEEKK